MTFDVKHWLLTHALWIVALGVGFVGFNSWRSEHDARLAAQITISKDEQQVKSLQDQIGQNNSAIASLQQQMTQRDQNAAKQINQLTTLVSKVQTVPQAVAALPQVSQLPVAPTVQSDNSVVLPSADVLPLFQQLSDGKECAVKLNTCQADLTDEKAIDAKDQSTITDQTKQLALKNDEIQALKKKPSFWHRVGTTMKEVGIGVGIGFGLAHKF